MTPIESRADFPAEPASAGHARQFVNSTLRTWHFDQLIDIAELLVSELVSNAILHAGTTIWVAVNRRDDRLRVEVTDGSSRGLSRKHYSSLSTTGRGLLLVEAMADDWGVATTRSGKTVWFELAAPERDIVGDRTLAGQRPAEGAPPARQTNDAGAAPRVSGGPVGGSDSPRLRMLVGAARR